jgi:hypothetical protein
MELVLAYVIKKSRNTRAARRYDPLGVDTKLHKKGKYKRLLNKMKSTISKL